MRCIPALLPWRVQDTIATTLSKEEEEEEMSINPLIRCWDGSHKSGCVQNSQMNNFCREQNSHFNPTGLWTVSAVTTLSLMQLSISGDWRSPQWLTSQICHQRSKNFHFRVWRRQPECLDVKQPSAQGKETGLWNANPSVKVTSTGPLRFCPSFFVPWLQEKCDYKFVLPWAVWLQEIAVGFIPPHRYSNSHTHVEMVMVYWAVVFSSFSTRTPGGRMMLLAIPKECGRKTQGQWAALPKVMATGVAKVLFSLTMNERSRGRGVPWHNELLWQVIWQVIGVCYLHTGVPICANTSTQ